MLARLLNEPALISGVINTGLLAAVTLGLTLTEAQIVAVMAFVNAVLAMGVRMVSVPTAVAQARMDAGLHPLKSAKDQ